MEFRYATNADSPAVISLIDRIYREYGDQIFLEGFDQDLLDLESNYAAKGGEFVVLDSGTEIVGTHATLPVDPEQGLVTFRRLYLTQEWRGGNLGPYLMDWALGWARERNFRRVEFWSDVRFERAHKFFASYGFKKGVRAMIDGWMPYSEYFFSLDLAAA